MQHQKEICKKKNTGVGGDFSPWDLFNKMSSIVNKIILRAKIYFYSHVYWNYRDTIFLRGGYYY